MRKLKAFFLTLLSVICCASTITGVALSVEVKADYQTQYNENAQIFLDIYDDGEYGEGFSKIWDTGEVTQAYTDADSSKKVLAFDSSKNAAITNTEFYIDFGKEINLRTGDGLADDFYKKASVEFWIKLNEVPASFFNCYLFQYRGESYADKPVNEQYVRSNVGIRPYVDVSSSGIGEWQYVQMPLSVFSSNGETVENGVKVQNVAVDFTKISAIGFAHMWDKAPTELANPTVEYSEIKICYGNLPDLNLGVTVMDRASFNAKKETATFTPIDLKPYATTGFTGGMGVGWTNQGSGNELTGFDEFGKQEYNGVPFEIIDQAENNNKSVIGLRSSEHTVSPLFTESVTVPIGMKADGAYMIHNMSWESKVVAIYTWVYDDGSEESVEIVNGQHIYNWWKSEESTVCPIIWKGENSEAGAMSLGIKLNMFAFVNPKPEKTIKELRFEIGHKENEAACMIVALTMADFGGDGLFMPLKENIYNPDTSEWYKYELADLSQIIGSALDVSYLLDTNVDTHGHVNADGDSFVFDDGTEARFWGVNVVAYAIFQDKEDTKLLIDTIAASGYNLIRLLDWDAQYYYPNIFGYNGDNIHVAEEQLDQFNYFWAYCKEKGIYLDFVMLGCRSASASLTEGGLTDSEIKDILPGYKFEVYIDPELEQATYTLAKEVMGVVNPYTGTKLAEDPVLAMVELTNESDIVGQWKEGTFSSDKYQTMLEEKFIDFLKGKYADDSALQTAWKEQGKTGLEIRKESLALNYVYIDHDVLTSTKYSKQRIKDTFEFVAELEKGLYDRMEAWAKSPEGLNLKSIVAGGTQMGSRERADLWINTEYDFIARHGYQSHPTTGTEYFVGCATGNSASMLGQVSNNVLASMATRKVLGLPYIVTEAQEAEPNVHTAEFNILSSAIYSYQGWSMVSFCFTNKNMDGRNNVISNSFSILDHPTRYSTSQSASLLYMRDEITKASKGYYRAISIDDVYDLNDQYFGLPAGTYIIGRAGIYFVGKDGNVLYTPEGVEITEYESDASILEKIKHSSLISEGGEIIWSQNDQQAIINTHSTQSVVGYISNKQFALNDVDIFTTTNFASITVSALNRKIDNSIDMSLTLKNAERILVTATAQARNTGAELSADGNSITALGEGPIIVEPVKGTIVFKTFDELEIWILNTSGQRVRKATYAKNDDGWTVLTMSAEDKTTYYEVIRTAVSDKKNDYAFADMTSENEKIINAVKDYLPTKTNSLYLVNEGIERGDFVGAIVRALKLTSDNTRAYADADSKHQAYEEFKISRGLGLVDALQIKAYDILKAIDGYKIIHASLTQKGIVFAGDKAELSANADFNAEGLTDADIQVIADLISVGVVSINDVLSVDFATQTVTRGEGAELVYNAMTAKNAEPNSSSSGNGQEPAESLSVGVIIAIIVGALAVVGGAVVLVLKLKRKGK